MATPVDAGSIYSDVRIRLDKLSGDVSSVKTQFDKLNANTQTANTKTEKSFKSLSIAGVAAITGITVAFKSAVSTFATTEQSLANVKAVSNATAAEFSLLEKAATSAGTTTRFTAGEAADALYNLASAGLDATQSVQALDGVLALAGATGSNLATASQAVTASLSQFGLEAEDAGKVSNVFAAAISNSQATLEKMKLSLTNVGPIAGALGISLEEVTGSLQSLYNAGYKGETAGTALKTSLAFLADQSSSTVAKLEALGVAFERINPEEVGLTGALEALEEAGLSTADVISAFGTEAGPAMVSLLSDGTDAIKEYTEAITDTDEAARQYAVQNDTLAGSFDAFKSAAEGASNSLVSQLAPILRTVLDMAAGVLKTIAGLPSVLKGLGAGAGAAAGGFIILAKALALLGVSLSTGPLGIVTLAGAAVVGLIALSKKMEDNRDRTDELAEVTNDLVSISGEYNEITAKLEGNVDNLSKAEKVSLELRKELLNLQLAEKLSAYAAEYALVTEQIENESKALEELNGRQEGNLEFNEKLESQEERILELKQKIIDMEAEQADGTATASEVFQLQTLKQAYDSVLESEEERLANRDEYKKRLSEEVTAQEASIASAKRQLSETQLAATSSINAFAKAYNEGSIDIEIYKVANEGLYNKIIEVAAGMKAAEDQITDTGTALDDTTTKTESSVQSWKDYLAAILGVDASGSGTDMANEFLDGFDREIDSSRTVEQALNGSLDSWDPSDLIESKIAGIKDVLQSLFAIDSDTIDSSFATTDKTVQTLVDSLRAAEEQLKGFADTSTDSAADFEAKWQEALESQGKTAIDVLADEKAQALAEAESLGADTTAVVAYYEEEKNKIKEQMREEDADSAEAYWSAEQELYMSRSSYMLSAATSFFSALSALSSATSEAAIAEIEAESAAKIAALDEDLLGEEEYDAQVTALEEEAAAAEADIEYDASMYEWKLSKLSAIASAAQAILQTFATYGATPWGFAAAATQGIVSGVQLSAINAAEPVHAATGGIILPSAGGTIVEAAENGSPELLLNGGSSGSEVMGTFADQLSAKMGGGSSSQNIVINLTSTLNGKVVAKDVVETYINKGVTPIDGSRGIY